MKRDANLVREELLGAELMAGRELTEAAGGFLDAIEKCGAIQQQQFRWYLEDWNDFWTTPLREPAASPTDAVRELVGRRSKHVGSGVKAVVELFRAETAPLEKIWSDYLRVVRQDWND